MNLLVHLFPNRAERAYDHSVLKFDKFLHKVLHAFLACRDLLQLRMRIHDLCFLLSCLLKGHTTVDVILTSVDHTKSSKLKAKLVFLESRSKILLASVALGLDK